MLHNKLRRINVITYQRLATSLQLILRLHDRSVVHAFGTFKLLMFTLFLSLQSLRGSKNALHSVVNSGVDLYSKAIATISSPRGKGTRVVAKVMFEHFTFESYYS